MSKSSSRYRMLVSGGVLCAAIITVVIIAVSPSKDTDEPLQGSPQTQPGASASESRPALEITEESLHKEAITAATRLMEDFPKSADPLGLMGTMYASFGNTTKALKCWQRCIELDPSGVEGYRCMAGVALKKGQFEKAEALARRALKANPAGHGIHGRLGEALMGLGKPKEAAAALQQDVKIRPRASVSYLLLGQAHQQLGEYEKAKANYMTALRIDPGYTEACYGIAVASARLGQEEDAAKYREKFKQMKAEDYERLPNTREVVAAAKSLVKLRRIVARTHTQVGMIYYDRGRLVTAEKHWQRAAALDPKDPVCRWQLVNLYQRDGRSDKALPLCEQVLRIVPKNSHYHMGYGMLLGRMNRIDDALTAVKRAMQLDPGNPTYWKVYQQLLRKQTK